MSGVVGFLRHQVLASPQPVNTRNMSHRKPIHSIPSVPHVRSPAQGRNADGRPRHGPAAALSPAALAVRLTLASARRVGLGIGLLWLLPASVAQAQQTPQTQAQAQVQTQAPAGAQAPSASAAPPERTLPAVRVTGSLTGDRFMVQERRASVGKGAASVQDTPFAMSVIDVEQIRETGAKNIQDALLYSAGVYAGRFGFDTRGDWAAVRGLAPSNYIDGLRGIYGFYNNVRPEIYSLSSVEVLKGPSSVLYGQGDLGGIVNVVSKRPQASAAREVEVQLGSHNRKQIGVDLTGPLNADQSLLYRLVALARNSDTQVDFVNDDAWLVQPSLTWKPDADTSLTLLYVHQRNDSKVSSQFLPFKGTLGPAPLGRIPSRRFAGEPGYDRYDTRKDEVSVFWDQRLSPDWKLAASLRKTDSDSVTREIWATVGAIPSDAGNISRTVHSADRATDVLSTDIRLEGVFALGPTRHQVAIGLDYQDALWEEFNYFNQTGVGSFNLYNPVYGSAGSLNLAALPLTDRADNKIEQAGIYLMDHMSWGPWVVSAALRHDRARNVVLNPTTPDTVVRNSATTGRLGAMYRFDNGLSPYLSFSNAFQPNLGTDGTPAAGFLKPTTGDQREAGLKYLSASGNTSAAFAWFDIEQQNRVVDGATPGGREQVGAAIRGWELELRQRLGSLELLGNYAKLDALNAATGLRLSSIAEETASAWGQYRFGGGWRVGLGARYLGSVTGANGAPVVPSVSLFDAMLGYTTGPWDIRFDIKNLADKEYVSWCRGVNQDCGYGERLNAALTVRYRF